MRKPAYRCPCGFFDRDGELLRKHMDEHHYDEIDNHWRINAALFVPFYVEVCLECDRPFDTLAKFILHMKTDHSPVLSDVSRRTKRRLRSGDSW